MNNIKDEFISFVKLYNDIKVDDDLVNIINQLEKFISKSDDVVKIIKEITDKKKEHLMILTDVGKYF
jgi:hypothetical protein